jgi:hypothetical protein
MSMREINGDDVRITFKCADCGEEDWASITYILDNGSLVCECGSDMNAISIAIEED